jgi:hypothetical protein
MAASFTIEGVHSITRDYKKYLASSSGSSLSAWKNLLVGTFYYGEHTSYSLRDILAGGIKKSFFFGIFCPSPYANFITLLERICKQNKNAAEVLEFLQKLQEKSNENEVVMLFFDYFLTVQAQCQANLLAEDTNAKRENFTFFLKALKKDINNLAEQLAVKDEQGNLKRIVKQVYSAELTQLKVQCAVGDPMQAYSNDNYTKNKQNNHIIKTACRRWAKIFAVFAAICEGFIGIMAMTNPFFYVPAFMGVAYIHYRFCKEDTYKIISDIALGRIFQRKNPKTGQYIALSNGEKWAISGLGSLSLCGGFCLYVLASAAMTASGLPLLLAIGVPVSLAITSIGVHFTVVEQLVKNRAGITRYFKEHFIHNTWQGCIWEAFKLGLSVSLMIVVALVTFSLFRSKGINVLVNTLQWCEIARATVVSTVFSLIATTMKFIFSLNKVPKLIDFIINKWKAVYNDFNKSSSHNPPNLIYKLNNRCETFQTGVSAVILAGNTGAKIVLFDDMGHRFYADPLITKTAGSAEGLYVTAANVPAFYTDKRQASRFFSSPSSVLKKKGKEDKESEHESKADPLSRFSKGKK